MDLCAGGRWEDELLPTKVDRLAKEIPDELWAEYPKIISSYKEGFHKITYRQLANIVNGLAWWIRESLGMPKPGSEIISYIGPNDLRYPAMVLAAAKAGYVLFLTSPRNSLAAHGKLFEELKCKVLISTESPTSLVSSIIAELGLRVLAAPSVAELLDKDYPDFPFTKDYHASLEEPFVIVHTSGSTGIPKPLTFTHLTAMRMIKQNMAEPPPGQKSLDYMHLGKRVLCAFPPFHGAGLVCYVYRAVVFKTVMVTPVAEGIVTAESLAAACTHTQIDIGLFVPSLIAELANNSDLLDLCAKHLEMILYCGGDLPQAVGDIISAKCPLYCQFGASELGMAAQLVPTNATRKDWHYIQLNPSLGVEFEPSADGLFEAHVKKDISKSETQSTFTILPKLHLLTDYATRDLFAPHPSIPDFWAYKARADDIIVFLNGEKTNPISMEQSIVSQSDTVQSVLVIGDQRFQAAVLLEPKEEVESKDQFIETIWPIIKQANIVAPAHARVEKRLIMLTTPDKPMIRAGKGTVQRKATLALYAEEIQQIYDSVENDLAEHDGKISSFTYEEMQEHIREATRSILGLDPKDDDNLFLLGMDSVQGLQLMRELRRRYHLPALTLQLIYKSPTVSDLARSLTENEATTSIDRKQQMRDVYEKLADQLQPNQSANSVDIQTPHTVILTGSTGGLGTYLLDTILNDPSTTHVYCLNRRMDDLETHLRRLNKRKDYTASMKEKVTFLNADLNKANFGLDTDTFHSLQAIPHYIIHNAWTVNFNLSLDYYIPQLQGLVNLLQFAASTSSRFAFISSISSVMSLTESSIPETIATSWDSPAHNGYAESKFIGEHLCAKAAENFGIPITSMRVGQIAGPVQVPGLWNPNEWVPTMVSTAMNLNVLPETLGPQLGHIDWVPIDLVSQSIWESVASTLPYTDVLHFCNPHSTDWVPVSWLFQKAIQEAMGEMIDIVSAEDWVYMAQNLADDNPTASVAKLIDFYRVNILGSGVQWSLDCRQAVARSRTLRSLPEVGSVWVEKWVREWHDYPGPGSKGMS